ncbi:MAG: electron transfer flavoprotein subunit beta/FixA family protein [Chloroflexota bacterium]
MRIAVLLKQVPDVIEELEIAPDGKDLARDDLKYRLNEFDDYALEEALQLKSAAGAEVVALALDGEEADLILYTALAKGADRVIKVTGVPADARGPRAGVAMFAEALRPLAPDLVLAGVQAPDDLEGQLAPLVAAALGLPHVNVVTAIAIDGEMASVTQEFSGGLVARLEGDLPLVVGVQASREAPRYAAITRVRQAMTAGKLETVAVAAAAAAPAPELRGLAKPEATTHAEMIEGSAVEMATRLVAILRERGFGGAQK